MNAQEIKTSVQEIGYDKTLALVIEDSRNSKICNCFGKRFNYESFSKTRIELALEK